MKILLIDDDSSSNYLNKRIISKCSNDINVIEFTNATEVLNFINQNDDIIDVIFLDLNMPIINGWEFLEIYKTFPNQKKAKQLIVLSATMNPLDIEKCQEIPDVNKFVSKPLSVDLISTIISEME